MRIPRIELFEWLRNNHERADYILAYSKMKGVSKREYDELVDYDPGPELDLGRGDPNGANEFKQILAQMYGQQAYQGAGKRRQRATLPLLYPDNTLI